MLIQPSLHNLCYNIPALPCGVSWCRLTRQLLSFFLFGAAVSHFTVCFCRRARISSHVLVCIFVCGVVSGDCECAGEGNGSRQYWLPQPDVRPPPPPCCAITSHSLCSVRHLTLRMTWDCVRGPVSVLVVSVSIAGLDDRTNSSVRSSLGVWLDVGISSIWKTL